MREVPKNFKINLKLAVSVVVDGGKFSGGRQGAEFFLKFLAEMYRSEEARVGKGCPY